MYWGQVLGSFAGVVYWNHVLGSYTRVVCWNHVLGSCSRIMCWGHVSLSTHLCCRVHPRVRVSPGLMFRGQADPAVLPCRSPHRRFSGDSPGWGSSKHKKPNHSPWRYLCINTLRHGLVDLMQLCLTFQHSYLPPIRGSKVTIIVNSCLIRSINLFPWPNVTLNLFCDLSNWHGKYTCPSYASVNISETKNIILSQRVWVAGNTWKIQHNHQYVIVTILTIWLDV